MDKFTFVIALVAVVMGAGVLRSYLLGQRRSPREPEGYADQMRGLDELEERIQVLEKIVTDQQYDLKQQFRDLGA